MKGSIRSVDVSNNRFSEGSSPCALFTKLFQRLVSPKLALILFGLKFYLRSDRVWLFLVLFFFPSRLVCFVTHSVT